MTGVEILSQSNVYEMDVYVWPLVVLPIVGLLIGLVLAIIDWVQCGFDAEWIGRIIILIIVCSFLGFAFTLLTEHETDTVDHIEYKVTIDDSVSMTEFMDKYEILDQEGKIYTVKERE